MSTQHSQNKYTAKEIKLDEVDENVSSIAVYKRSAIRSIAMKMVSKNISLTSCPFQMTFKN